MNYKERGITLRKFKDDKTHKMYRAFVRQRNQAAFRKEEWAITFEEWQALWTDETWENKGRKTHQYSMLRNDFQKGWTLDNVNVANRKAMHRYRIQTKTIKQQATIDKEFTYAGRPCKTCGNTHRYTACGSCIACYTRKHPNNRKEK